MRLRELTREAVDMGDDQSTREYNRRALAAFKQLQGREVTCFDAWLRSLDGGLTPILSRPRGVQSITKGNP